AEQHDIPLETPPRLRDKQALAKLTDLAPDAILVVAYGQILTQEVLDLPPLHCWNVHASLLPRWRGAAPIERAILAGDNETGVGIMRLTRKLDEGPILLEKRLPIDPDDTGGSLHDKLSALGGEALQEALPLIEGGQNKLLSQSEQSVTYAAKIDKAETRIDWSASVVDIERGVRAFNPSPGAWCLTPSGQRLKVLRAKVTASIKMSKAESLGAFVADHSAIACRDGLLVLEEVQPPGKKPMPLKSFLAGNAIQNGALFS
ncbi:hypothetical protein CAPTEDRAFT_92492, partial [Capitella teleta]